MFATGLVIGVIVGAVIGVFVVSLCFAAAKDGHREDDITQVLAENTGRGIQCETLSAGDG